MHVVYQGLVTGVKAVGVEVSGDGVGGVMIVVGVEERGVGGVVVPIEVRVE